MGRIIVRGPSAAIDPASLYHTGLWIAPFAAGSPLVGLASAGPSLGNDATEGTHPPTVGPSFAGKASISADGVDDRLVLDGTAADYVTNTGFSFWWLGRVNSVAIAVGDVVGDPGLLCDDAGAFGFNITNEGFTGFIQTVAGLKAATALCPVGSVVYCVARFDGAQLLVGVNGPPVEQALTPGPNNMDPAFRALRLFANYVPSKFLHVDMLGAGLSTVEFTDDEFAGMRSFLNTRFAL